MGILIINSKRHGVQRVLYDDMDHDLIMSQNSWVLRPRKDTFYAYCQLNTKAGRKGISMHRLIMGFPKGKEVDHKNRNGLDNRRDNLRIATKAENSKNKKAWGKSRYLGVSLDSAKRKLKPDCIRWLSCISINGKNKTLGRFNTEEEAAKKYNEFAKVVHGEFANLNNV